MGRLSFRDISAIPNPPVSVERLRPIRTIDENTGAAIELVEFSPQHFSGMSK
jgi:hypothetical protein